MTPSSKYMFKVTMLILSIVALWVTPGISYEDVHDKNSNDDPTLSDIFPPKQSHGGFYENLIHCSKKFANDCGLLTFSAIVHGNATLTYDCCDNIVNEVGKTCYDNLISPILNFPAFQANASRIEARNMRVWSKCDFMTKSLAPS